MKMTINKLEDGNYSVHEEDNLNVTEKHIIGNDNMLQNVVDFFGIKLEEELADADLEDAKEIEVEQKEAKEKDSDKSEKEDVIEFEEKKVSRETKNIDDIKIDYGVNEAQILKEAKEQQNTIPEKKVEPENFVKTTPIEEIPKEKSAETMKEVIEQDSKDNPLAPSIGWSTKKKRHWGPPSGEVK